MTRSLLTLALPSLILLTGCGGDEPPTTEIATPTAVEARVATAETASAEATLWLPAATEALRRVRPGTKILGRIAAVPVDEGQAVRRGAVLARLESADLEAAVERAEAAIAMAEARHENARAHEARLRQLYGRDAVTEKALEDAVAGLRTAEAAVAQANAAATASRVQLGYATVRAPFDGWVVAKHAEAGDMARPGEPMFTLDDLARLRVVAGVPESLRPGLEPGASVMVEVLGERYPATIDRIVPTGDPASRTLTLKLLIDNPEGALDAGLFARVGVPAADAGTPSNEPTVPTTALVERGQLRGLFVVEDGVARLRFVRVGAVTDRGATILSGLDVGERYLPTPPVGLLDGTPIREAA